MSERARDEVVAELLEGLAERLAGSIISGSATSLRSMDVDHLQEAAASLRGRAANGEPSAEQKRAALKLGYAGSPSVTDAKIESLRGEELDSFYLRAVALGMSPASASTEAAAPEREELCGAVCRPFRANCMLPREHQGPHSPTRPLETAAGSAERDPSASISWEDERKLRGLRSSLIREGEEWMPHVLALTRILDQLSRSCERCRDTGHDWEPGPTGEPLSTGPCPDCHSPSGELESDLDTTIKRLRQYAASQLGVSEALQNPLASDVIRVVDAVAGGSTPRWDAGLVSASRALRRYVLSHSPRESSPRVGDIARVLHALGEQREPADAETSALSGLAEMLSTASDEARIALYLEPGATPNFSAWLTPAERQELLRTLLSLEEIS